MINDGVVEKCQGQLMRRFVNNVSENVAEIIVASMWHYSKIADRTCIACKKNRLKRKELELRVAREKTKNGGGYIQITSSRMARNVVPGEFNYNWYLPHTQFF